jgi:hypothetical protein
VLVFAPRLSQRLLDEIERRAHDSVPIAEINRRVGRAAAEMRLYKPSYQQVRVLVHAARELRRTAPKPVSTIAAEVVFRVIPTRAAAEYWGEGPPPRLRDRAPPRS